LYRFDLFLASYSSAELVYSSIKQSNNVLFELYPDIEKAFKLSEKLKQLYNLKITKGIAMTKLAHWYK
jgi:transposase